MGVAVKCSVVYRQCLEYKICEIRLVLGVARAVGVWLMQAGRVSARTRTTVAAAALRCCPVLQCCTYAVVCTCSAETQILSLIHMTGSNTFLCSGSYLKREGRPRDDDVLVARLVDRPLRPMLEKGWCNETQVHRQCAFLNSLRI
jgi:hypothetical protein